MRSLCLSLWLLASAAGAQPATYVVDALPFSLKGQWWFRTGHDPAWSSPFREKTHWQAIQVPGPWEKQGYPGYNGHAWYRITLQLPSRFSGESLGVDLGILGDVDEVFLNGQRIGESGAFPPTYEPATLHRRIYRLPRASLRFGELNELAVHVYNEWRFGGFLGPPPLVDRYEKLIANQTGRDLALWVGAAVLGVLALFHSLISLFYGGGREQWAWVGFLVSFALYQITYANLGPSFFFSAGLSFRLNVVFLLLAVGLFPLVLATVFGQPAPTLALVFASVMAVGSGFALLWRRAADLYLWVYLAEMGIAVIVSLSLWLFFRQQRLQRALPWPLLGTAPVFFGTVLADVAVDLCLLPRPTSPVLVLYSSLGVLPFAFTLAFVLTTRWARMHAASLLPHLGLLPWTTFTQEVHKRLIASPPSPFALALMRFSTAAGTPVEVETVVSHLRLHLRHCDLLARYSRETVAILLDNQDEREALAFLERVRRALRQLPDRFLLRPTVGLAAFKAGRYATAEELVKAADAALYAARAEGGDCTATAP